MIFLAPVLFFSMRSEMRVIDATEVNKIVAKLAKTLGKHKLAVAKLQLEIAAAAAKHEVQVANLRKEWTAERRTEQHGQEEVDALVDELVDEHRRRKKEHYCALDGSDYAGSVAFTRQGVPCAKWSEQTRDKSRRRVGGHNFCRNPDNDPLGPWCYSNDWYERSVAGTPGKAYCDVGARDKSCYAFCSDKAAISSYMGSVYATGGYAAAKTKLAALCRERHNASIVCTPENSAARGGPPNRQPQVCRETQLLDVLDEAGAHLSAMGLRWFVSGGGLLGILRFGDMLPWDKDIDIEFIVTAEEAPGFVKRLSEAFKDHPTVDYVPQVGFVARRCNKCCIVAENTTMAIEARMSIAGEGVNFGYINSYVDNSKGYGRHCIPRSWVLPLRPLPLGRLCVPTPARPALWLRTEELIHEAEEGGENTAWLERIEFGIHVQNEATRQTVLDDLVPRIRAYQKNRRSCKIKQPFLQWSVKAKHDTSCMGSPQCDCSWLKKPCEDGFEGDGTSCRKHCCCQRAMESEVMNR